MAIAYYYYYQFYLLDSNRSVQIMERQKNKNIDKFITHKDRKLPSSPTQ